MRDDYKKVLSDFGELFSDVLLARDHGRKFLQFEHDVSQIAADWVHADVKVLASGINSQAEIRLACTELELASNFIDAVLSSYNGASDQCAALSPEIPFALDGRLSRRVKDVAATLILGGKPILCPFTGTRALVRDTIDIHTFLHRYEHRACIVLPDWRVDQFASDRCWFFPDRNLILVSVPHYDVRLALIRTATRVMENCDRVVAYLANPSRSLMVSEDAMSHIGHYIWNITSGWSPLYSLIQPDCIDILTSYPNWQIFGGVTELYPDLAACAGAVIRPASHNELYDLILSRNATSLVLLGGHITADAAQRVIALSRNRCDNNFHAEIADLRRKCFPLIMLTIRTENRAWIEQQEGYASLINELVQSFPRLGIILDGINFGMAQVATHRLMSLDEEQAIAGAIIEACPTVQIHNSVGCQPHESIVLAEAIDAFLAPVGAGLAKTRWIANKPGVGFSNRTFMQPGNYDGFLYDRFREDLVLMRYVDLASVEDVEESRHCEKSRANFSMSWQAPYKELKILLETMLESGQSRQAILTSQQSPA